MTLKNRIVQNQNCNEIRKMKILNMRSFPTPVLEGMSTNGKIHSLTKKRDENKLLQMATAA